MTKAQIKQLIDNNFADFSNIVPQLARAVYYELLNGISIKGEIKTIALIGSLIGTHFDSSGLGKVGGEYETWAICNGQNGTIDMSGRVAIGYDATNYPTLNTSIGNKEYQMTAANLPKHRHKMFRMFSYQGNISAVVGPEETPVTEDGRSYEEKAYQITGVPEEANTGVTGYTGAEEANTKISLIQPSMVLLMIQKL